MSDNIKVAIKVRPLIKRELDENLAVQWVVQGNSISSTDPEMKKRADGRFAFDHIFDMDVTNAQVFNSTVKPIVDGAVKGFNGTVFAYGQTSSGKTYTMMGNSAEPGIIPLVIEHMFDAIADTEGREFLIRVSYIEIYNEKVNDLLSKNQTDLKLHEDGSGQIIVNCKEEVTNCPENVLSIMKKGDKNRRTGETNMNERSSRSHSIFRITIESREAGGDSDVAIQVSQLNLIDLAGSERARQTGATGDRFKEGRHINLSLSTLALVIMQLSEPQESQKHVNFRDSKLTRLLQSSLGGNAMTTIICAVTPAALEETQCTLSFASRAKRIKNKPHLNEVMSDAALLKRYAKQIAKLNTELEEMKKEDRRSAEVEEMESKLLETDRNNRLLQERIELLKACIVSGNNTAPEEPFICKSRRRTWGGPGTLKPHFPAIQPKTGLPTIKEMSPEKLHRESMIQSVDILNETFQTAFADFELELIESERDRRATIFVKECREEQRVTKRKNKPRVTFTDDVFILNSANQSFNTTPEKRDVSIQASSCGDQSSPGTPKNVLRMCVMKVTKELNELREFTTLEKQMMREDDPSYRHEEETRNHSNVVKSSDALFPENQTGKSTGGITDSNLEPDQSERKNSTVEREQLGAIRKRFEEIPEVNERLKDLNLSEEVNIERIISQLCVKLKEAEERNVSEKASNLEARRKVSELEKQVENIAAERNDFEYMATDSRTKLHNKILELEERIDGITNEKKKFERENMNLRGELKATVSKTEERIKNLTSERDDFQYMNSQLRAELNEKLKEAELSGDRNFINENNNLKSYIKDLQDLMKNVQNENKDLREKVEKQVATKCPEINESKDDDRKSTSYLEDKTKLEEAIEMKDQELEEIKNFVQSLKLDIQELQHTILLLTTENMDMSTKLSIAKVRGSEKTTDFENSLTIHSEQLEERKDDDRLLHEDQIKTEKFSQDNIQFSVAEKNQEVEKIKESKSLLCEHECLYRDKVARLTKTNASLTAENNDLSTELMDKIEELDVLREQCETFKNKLELSSTKSVNSFETEIDQSSCENILRAEIAELKAKLAVLSDENAKFSNDLFETLENLKLSGTLDNSRNEKSFNSTLRQSRSFDKGADQSAPDETPEMLLKKIAKLEETITHLTVLNKKLTELKLTSCTQCSHLKILNQNRRALKIEAKTLNHKLEDLQKQFDRKSAEVESLKSKANQELNISLSDTLNATFDGMNVSYVEEKVQHLSSELQSLKDDHDKLSVLYQEKCDELDKLHDDAVSTGSTDSAGSKRKHKSETRIDEVQKSIDRVKEDIDQLKKNHGNFTPILEKFVSEKTSLTAKINELRNNNEELSRKLSEHEVSVATATEEAKILEDDLTNVSKEMEEFTAREKVTQSEKLMLEVELEALRVERENKDVLINRLHQTIDELNEQLSSLKSELDSMTREKENFIASAEFVECKRKGELESMRMRIDELENEKRACEEGEKRATLWAKELETDVEKYQLDLAKQESVQKELQEEITRLERLLEERENKNPILEENSKNLDDRPTVSQDSQEKYKDEVDSLSRKFEEYKKESEGKLQEMNSTLRARVQENDELIQQLGQLREQKFNEVTNEGEDGPSKEKSLADGKKLREELNTVRDCILKELKSLKRQVNLDDFLKKPVNEIFITFLQTLMSKEEEVAKAMQDRFDRAKQKLEDEKRQSADAEKRAASWAKELETEAEKLQRDLAKQETLIGRLQERISQLEHLLKESKNENQSLKEKMEAVESDFNNLQTEFDKQRKVDVRQEEAISAVQKKEKEVQEAFRFKEIELQSKIEAVEEKYKRKVDELVFAIELQKTENIELKSNIEGFEASEKQLKNIIEANSLELKNSNQNLNKLNVELEQITEAYNELNRDIMAKNGRIEEITALLKSKCDTLSEYKTKLQTIMPDYELLKDQIAERKATIERCKEEIAELKEDREKQIDLIKDKLNSEEIENVRLSKQLVELSNKNTVLVSELDDLKEKYEELQRENAKLERKVRNSTSKIKAESEIEELKDSNKRLQNSFEGASNRITELQENKNQMLKELASLKSQYDLAKQENDELRKAVATKQTTVNFPEECDKYHALLQEKNKLALELEGNKLLLSQQETKIQKYVERVKELTKENKEMDTELEDYAKIIRDLEAENGKLDDKLYSYLSGNAAYTEQEEKIKQLLEENEKVKDQLDVAKIKLQAQRGQMDDFQSCNAKLSTEVKELDRLRRENSELETKVAELENKLESRSNSNSSRSNSPGFEINRRRRSRNEIFNHRRQLESVTQDKELDVNEDQCEMLRKQVRELELTLVSKNGKIATLELQIMSKNFPYQNKCKDMEEQLLAFRNKNVELNSEIRKLQKAMSDTNARECDICKRWRENRRDQSCQTIPDTTNMMRFRSQNSGVVDDHMKILKLENDKVFLKKLCRSRHRQINELEERIQELENVQSTPVFKPVESSQEKSNLPYLPSTSSDDRPNPKTNFKP